MITINQYPQLKTIAWNVHTKEIDEQFALNLYELNWRYVDEMNLKDNERQLINNLVKNYGHGVLNV